MHTTHAEDNSVVAVFIILGALFILGPMLVSFISGWSLLKQYYRLRKPFEGRRYPFQWGKVGNLRYSFMTFGANSEGLYCAVFFPSRIGHPPLFIPWSDISFRARKGFMGGYRELTLKQAPSVKLAIGESLYQSIKASR